ncbi:TRAFAC clade GTPase domain-containing protein [Budvicia aquatica]|uniref:Double-GTPase 2 domain-containing protein n=1 Tax=Budvicia aquatica TaxID=82979 RepID=A0A2C6DQC1_9GAMM|nr:hypothetical protein [Budvicia aquatica]PHI30893.1 hypothetical protein CRN84_16885 [Budvicia aquatica]VFS50785.1 Uncharacterised protein [Budvicia aquatica]
MTEMLSCGRPDCEVSKTGICIEGHSPLQSCSFFGKSNIDELDVLEYDIAVEDIIEENEIPIEESRIRLPSGENLTIDEVDRFLLYRPVRFVTIIGEFDSGKTTLICSLYEKFLKGNFSGYIFSGSRTLVGFEKKTHHSRVDSGRASPDTTRTSLLDGLRYYHLSLTKHSTDLSSKRIELMISDRAGESYQRARYNSIYIEELIELQKSDYIVILLDGARLAVPFERHNTMSSVRQTLMAFISKGYLSKQSRVQIVTTKIDLLKHIEDSDLLNKLLAEFRTGLLNDFGESLGELIFSDISARDPLNSYPIAHGVDALLDSWCEPTPINYQKMYNDINLTTEFDLLLLRTPTKG